MKQRSILMQAHSVQGILGDWKSVTRRVIKSRERTTQIQDAAHSCPYGQPGDRLYVKETWGVTVSEKGDFDVVYRADFPGGERQSWRDYEERYEHLWRGLYGADGRPLENPFSETNELRWRSPLFMPRAFSRLTLEICSVRVERLQDITAEDCLKEGVPICCSPDGEKLYTQSGVLRSQFAALWDSINGKTFPWQSNPFVWRLEFRRLEADRDETVRFERS